MPRATDSIRSSRSRAEHNLAGEVNRYDLGGLATRGTSLAQSLLTYRSRRDVVVLAVTHASLPIAEGVADVLNVPYDIFLVRKIVVPGYEGVIAGAVARGAYIPSAKALGDAGISLISFVEAAKLQEGIITREETSYRKGRAPALLTGATIILVDDGRSSAEDLFIAIAALRRHFIADIAVVAPLS